MKNKKNYALLVGAVLAILGVMLGLIYYFIMPTLSLQYFGDNMRLAIIVFLIGGAIIAASFKHSSAIGGTLVLFAIVLFLGNILVSSQMLHVDEYTSLVGEFETYDYNKETPNITNMPIVDEELAIKLGDKTLGADLSISSKYTAGEYFLIKDGDSLAWVAPLEPNSFFKWNKTKSSPGYIYVSAEDTNDVRLVESPINYSQGAYFSNNLNRHVYMNGYKRYSHSKPAFEIDDEGNPYWVISMLRSDIGTSGLVTDKVVTVDAETGDIKEYEPGKEPNWVDRVYDKSLLEKNISYYGDLNNGYWNFSGDGKLQTSGGNTSSYILVDNEPYMYTGLTSQQSDESTIGFALVSLKTGQVKYYSLTGATEIAAAASAEGAVQQYGYIASYPMLTNIEGNATYFMTLKDEQGLVKQYAYVSVEDYSTVGIGNTQESALQSYKSQMGSNVSTEGTEVTETTGKVSDKVVTSVSTSSDTVTLTFTDGTNETYEMQ